MKISPAVNEFVERGMRTGTSPASIASRLPTTTFHQAALGSAATWLSE